MFSHDRPCPKGCPATAGKNGSAAGQPSDSDLRIGGELELEGKQSLDGSLGTCPHQEKRLIDPAKNGKLSDTPR